MIAWLWNNFIGQFCSHKWEEIDRCNLILREGATPHGQKYTLRCKKCGNIKRVIT